MLSKFMFRPARKIIFSSLKSVSSKIPMENQNQLFRTFSSKNEDDSKNNSALGMNSEISVGVKYKNLIDEMVECGFIRSSFENYTEKDFTSYLKLLVTEEELVELKKTYDLDEVMKKLNPKTDTNLRHCLTYIIGDLAKFNEGPPDGSGQRKLYRKELFEIGLRRVPLLADAKYKYLKNEIKLMLEKPIEIRKSDEKSTDQFQEDFYEAKLENGMSAKIILRQSAFWSSITLMDGDNKWEERIDRETLLSALKNYWILKTIV